MTIILLSFICNENIDIEHTYLINLFFLVFNNAKINIIKNNELK